MATIATAESGENGRIASVLDRFRGRDVASAPWFRAGLVLIAVVVAYRYSLTSLLGTVSTDTPLAYLGLAPIIALGVALMLGRPHRPGADVHDRYIDYLIGVPLLATALLMTVVLPERMSILFWYYRVDLLSLPLFAAGAVALLFGAATLWRVRYAVAFLLLAWPAPYNYLLNHDLNSFTNLTLVALKTLLRIVPVAVPAVGGDGSLFTVHHASQNFTLSVASACTGVDSFIGFALVGLAVLALVDGPRLGKITWLFSGMVLAYALNLVRLLLIFWVGSRYGQAVALDGLHPVLGLILFGAGTALMVTILGRYKLEVRPGPPKLAQSTTQLAQSTTQPIDAAHGGGWRLSGRLVGAAAALAVVTAAVAVADGGFGRYGPVASQLGAPRLVSFADSPIQPAGWSVQAIDHYSWASQYFGSGAVWTRYLYSPSASNSRTVLADVIDTGDLQSFTTYDVISCYDYHGYGLSNIHRISLGDGVEATELTFDVPSLSGQWNALYWIWPVKQGTGVRYERIVLLAPVDSSYVATSSYRGPVTSAANDREMSRTFLVHFGQTVVGTRTANPNGAIPG